MDVHISMQFLSAVLSLFMVLWRGASRLRSLAVIRVGGLVRASSVPSSSRQAMAHGIDCACYFSENFFIRSPVEAHFTYGGAAEFAQKHARLLGTLTADQRDELLRNLEAEHERRSSQPRLAAARKERIAREYSRLHPGLWTLKEEWLHPQFVALVRSVGSSAWAPPTALTSGVYTLPVFSARFCEMLCEELDSLKRAGLPLGQPNSMNRFGALLDEIGLTPALLDPLLRDWLRPLCAALPPLAAAGGATLDHHRSFVVMYTLLLQLL